MKKIFLATAAIIIAINTYAKSESLDKIIARPDTNNRNLDRNQNKTNDLDNNQNLDTVKLNNPNGTMNQNQEMNQTPKMQFSADSTIQMKPVKTNYADGFLMQDGKMMYSKNGETVPMINDYVFPNGTQIMVDGTYMRKGGRKTMLYNGQYVDLSGRIVQNN